MQSGKQKTALGAVLNERLLQAEGGKNKEIIINKKADWLLQGYFLDHLSSAHQATPD